MRITSVLAVMLAGVLFVFPVVFGVRSDERTNAFLATRGVREKFETATDSKAKPSEDRASPLVQQAEAFALYLNPPKPNVAAALKKPKAAGMLPAMPATTPKFKVFATSYLENNPEMSLALIDEPGSGRRWVRQSSNVGHLVIEQVRDGLVVVKSNEETFEVAIEQNPETSPAKPIPAVSTPRSAPTRSISALPTSARTSSRAVPVGRSRSLPEQRGNTEKDAKLQELAKQLIDVQKNGASENDNSGLTQDEKTARTLELIRQYRAAQRSARVSPKEAKKLGDLGQTLEDAGPEPNQALPATGEGKVEAGPTEPNGLGEK
ncbi:MAG: hypothetical protein ACYTAO_05030 [Planctomycetota bacterium]